MSTLSKLNCQISVFYQTNLKERQQKKQNIAQKPTKYCH